MGCVAEVRLGRTPRNHLQVVLIGLVAFCIAACGERPTEKVVEQPRPQQAGQPVNPYTTAGHVLAVRAAAVTGDTRTAEQHLNDMARDYTRAAGIRDFRRPVDHEAARTAVRPLAGVRSSVWIDADNLLVMVDGQKHRSIDMIDQVCLALEPLGDTLGVVVNLQDVAARNGDEAQTLSRNCQLPEGQRAFLQAKRQVDAVPPQVREQFKKMQRE